MRKWWIMALVLATSFFYSKISVAASYTISITDERMVPNVIKVTAKQKTHFTIHNYGKKTHNFVLPAFYIFTPNLSPQEGTTVEFVPEKKGSFTFFSDTGGQPEPGLSGTIQVK